MERFNLNNRYLGAVLLSPLLLFIYFGGMYLHILALILSLIGMYEFYRVTKKKNINPIEKVGYSLCIVYYFILLYSQNLSSIFLIILLFIVLLLCIPVLNTKYNFIDISITVLGFIYVGVFFSFIPLISGKSYGNLLVWIIFIASWSTDTMAYYTGKAFGSHKLCEKVSPKKTVEGSVGGLIGSTLICGIFGIVLLGNIGDIPSYHFFLIGAVCGVMCQFGDLVASSIKRFTGVKDYSNLIPGHGGILDRFDSILFSAIVVFYYLTFVIGI
jgi:phosphatidate cytidylyltransferase